MHHKAELKERGGREGGRSRSKAKEIELEIEREELNYVIFNASLNQICNIINRLTASLVRQYIRKTALSASPSSEVPSTIASEVIQAINTDPTIETGIVGTVINSHVTELSSETRITYASKGIEPIHTCPIITISLRTIINVILT